ncbi:hypothetical protein NQ314_009624 [Rhamnusium bicolor]|uniref:THAP-type domain-containing protein n=1 Tax=Rhamnusium bicolor TaxID=1586634 RepID=A0AAV8XY65_9CUCU|nr:hypothetical protein NQ314_009624 [Rhamnusium bicolor]
MKACYIDQTEFKESMKVCSNHFLVTDYDSTIWPTRKLLKTAVPSPGDQYPKIYIRMQKRKALVQDINLPVPEKKHRTMISQPISLGDLLEAGLSTQVSDKAAPQNIEQATEMHRSTILQPITPIDLLEAGPSKHLLDIEAPQNTQQDLIPTINLQKTPEEQIILDARYVGDLTPEHFGAPRKACRLLQLVKHFSISANHLCVYKSFKMLCLYM